MSKFHSIHQESAVQEHDDFDFEHSPGIPAALPPGEQIVWQGSPDKWELAKNAFHLRKIALYFFILLVVHLFSVINAQSNGQVPTVSFTTTLLMSLTGLGILSVLAWLTANVTIYTVTNRRILIRFGVALQITINLPFAQIKGADMRVDKRGFGDIPLMLKDSRQVNYFILWPHVRPWNFSQPQPMLRCIPKVEHVARIIGEVAAQTPDTLSSPSTPASQATNLPEAGLMQSEAL